MSKVYQNIVRVFVRASSSEAHTSGDHYNFIFFVSPDFYELWVQCDWISVCSMKLSSNGLH